jgi:SseB protein N-terminal domain
MAAMAADTTPPAYLRAVASLCGDRLLVPVVATATRLGEAQDGRRALLAFTGLDSLQGWQPGARPVPVTLDRAAQTARNEDLAALLIDIAGPHTLVIEGDVLDELAAGHRLVELSDGEFGWVTPAVPRE